MSLRNERSDFRKHTSRETSRLAFEQLEARLMNAIDGVENHLRVLTNFSSGGDTRGETHVATNVAPAFSSTQNNTGGSEVRGRTTGASVLGSDDKGEANLRYYWQPVSLPLGGSVAFATNGTNAAKNNSLTFNRAGSYSVRVTIADAEGLTTAKTLQFNVVQTLSSIRASSENGGAIDPLKPLIVTGTSQKLNVRGLDQFGNPMAVTPTFSLTATAAAEGSKFSATFSDGSVNLSFSRVGKYALRTQNGTTAFNFYANVVPTVSAITVTPDTAGLKTEQKQQFRIQAIDQFKQPLPTPPPAIWSATGGTITDGGLFTAGKTAGAFTVTARVGSITSTVKVQVTAPELQPALHNQTISNLVASFYDDKQLSRTEMMQILRSAGKDGAVDASELADFQYLVSSNSSYTMPSYVKELARDVVIGNAANRSFHGQAAGNLATGSSATLLNNLVDKWFLGADEPAISNPSLSYQTAIGNLYTGTPALNDAHQGMLGDCYFISSLVSIANENPDAIRKMFIDNGDDTFTVRFFAGALGSFYNNGTISAGFVSGSGTADYVTVNRRLPANSSGLLGYSGYYQSVTNSSIPLWIALAEKAYAEWNETGKEGRDGTNRYAAIEGGWMANVNAQILGYNSTSYSASAVSSQTIITAINAGRAVTLGTTSQPTDGFVGSHAYVVSGYNATTQKFTVFNPWGVSHPAPLTWSQLASNSTGFVVADPSGSVTVNQSTLRSGVVQATLIGNWTAINPALASLVADDNKEMLFVAIDADSPLLMNQSFNAGDSSVAKVNSDEPALTEESGNPLSEHNQFVSCLTPSLVDLAMASLKIKLTCQG